MIAMSLQLPRTRTLHICALIAAFTLALTTHAQTYTWNNVKIVGGGFVDGIVAQPLQNGLFYARTDVGGAYRYNSSTSTWIPLLDWVGASNWWYTGVESIAIDPQDASKLYMAVGQYTENYDGNGAILVSGDQGNTFTTVAMPFRMGSNDNGRNGGERLQVDPNDSAILFYGSYNSGLWTSTNSGTTWNKSNSFPVTGATAGAGIIFVAFDKTTGSTSPIRPSQTIYVGVSDTGTSSTGYSSLYVTTNGGSTWSPVAGQPTGLYPSHGLFSNDAQRELYMTFSNAIGPTGMTSGQVWRLHASNGSWTNISPANPNNYTYGFGGLAIDPQQSGRLLISTMDRYYPGDTMFLTDTANSATTTWNDVGSKATWNSSLSPWVNFGASTAGIGNWLAAMVIDPNNQNHAMYGTGQTLWSSTDLLNADSNTATAWSIGANGIEETVTTILVAPTAGPYLFSGCWDLGGFVHTSLTTSPSGGMFENPRINKDIGIDYAKNATATVVRSGYNGGGYSTNSGSTWTPFASNAGSTNGGGTIAISGDATTIVYSPSDVAPSYSTNNGTTWTDLSGTLPLGAWVVSDGSSNGRIYAWDATNGVFYASSTKGTTWYTAASGLATGGKAVTVFGKIGDIWIENGSGIYRSSNAGTSWAQIGAETVTAATAIGFGKASGTGYPAIYLIGTVSGVTGVFRSLDTGGTWQQINDANHQWGAINEITGDPKTFGTVYIGTPGRGVIYGTSTN